MLTVRFSLGTVSVCLCFVNCAIYLYVMLGTLWLDLRICMGRSRTCRSCLRVWETEREGKEEEEEERVAGEEEEKKEGREFFFFFFEIIV